MECTTIKWYRILEIVPIAMNVPRQTNQTISTNWDRNGVRYLNTKTGIRNILEQIVNPIFWFFFGFYFHQTTARYKRPKQEKNRQTNEWNKQMLTHTHTHTHTKLVFADQLLAIISGAARVFGFRISFVILQAPYKAFNIFLLYDKIKLPKSKTQT